MIRTLLAGSAAAALLVTGAAAGPGISTAANDSAWQMAQAQTDQPAQPPAAGEPAAPGADQPPAAADQPPAADQPAGQTAQEPAAPDQPAETAQDPAAPDQPAETAEEPPAGDQPEQAAEAPVPMDSEVFITEQAEEQWLASDYIGKAVYNRADESIGNVDDLIVEEEGGVAGVVVGVGGFLGIGKKRVAVDLAAVEIQQDEDGQPKLVMDGSREALMEAPDFTDKAAQQAEQERQQREAQQPAGGATGGMGGVPGGAPGAPGGAPGQ